MSKNIIDRHAEEWEDYLQAYDTSRNQLEADEFLIRKQFGMNDKNLPAEWRDMIGRHRQAWVDEWGVKGRRSEELKARHNDEIKAAYQNGFPEIIPVQMPEPQPVLFSPDIPSYTDEEMNQMHAGQWDAAKKRLEGELNAIEAAYKEWGIPVPQATQKRMALRAMAFKQQWDGIEPETPLNEVKILSDQDHQNHFQSFRDLDKSHKIIEAHYGHPDKVPHETRKELTQETDGFHNEIDTYRTQRKQEREAFKIRLETMREQNQTPTRRPK